MLVLCSGDSYALLPPNRLGVGDTARGSPRWAEGSLCLRIDQAPPRMLQIPCDNQPYEILSQGIRGPDSPRTALESCCQPPEETRPAFYPCHGIAGSQSALDHQAGFLGILTSLSNSSASFHHLKDSSTSLRQT